MSAAVANTFLWSEECYAVRLVLGKCHRSFVFSIYVCGKGLFPNNCLLAVSAFFPSFLVREMGNFHSSSFQYSKTSVSRYFWPEGGDISMKEPGSKTRRWHEKCHFPNYKQLWENAVVRNPPPGCEKTDFLSLCSPLFKQNNIQLFFEFLCFFFS